MWIFILVLCAFLQDQIFRPELQLVLCAFLQDQNFRPSLDWTWCNTNWLKILDWWDGLKQYEEHHYNAATSVWSTRPVMGSRPTEMGQRTGVTCIIITRCQLMMCLYMDNTRLYRYIMTVYLEILIARDHLDEENWTFFDIYSLYMFYL